MKLGKSLKDFWVWLHGITGAAAVLIGAVASFFSDEVKRSYWVCDFLKNHGFSIKEDCFTSNSDPFMLGGLTIGTLVIAIAYAVSKGKETTDQQAAHAQLVELVDLTKTISLTPPDSFMRVYQENYLMGQSAYIFAEHNLSILENNCEIEDGQSKSKALVEDGIRTILNLIGGVIQAYEDKEHPTYGINVMIFAPPHLSNKKLVKKIFKQTKSFQDDEYEGFLELYTELSIRSGQDSPTPDDRLESISLPILKKENMEKEGKLLRYAAPGAQQAFFRGVSQVSSIQEMKEWLESEKCFYGNDAKQDILMYFSDDGPGKHIKSFASFLISIPVICGKDVAKKKIGVLNIDHDMDGIFKNRRGCEQLEIILSPMLYYLGILVERWISLHHQTPPKI